LMQPLRAQYAGSYDKNEVRASRYGAYDFFASQSKLNSGIFTPEIKQKIKGSFGNSVQVPVMNNNAANITIGNVRSCVIADSENTSALVTLTLITYVFGFTMYPAQYENNDIAYGQDFRRKLDERLIKFAATLDAQSIATIEANKNTFWTNIAGAPYTQTANALQVSQAQKNDYYNNIDAIMNRMDFYGQNHVITSPYHQPMVRRLAAQGSSNETNQAFQLPPYQWHWTNQIIPGAGLESTLYMVQDGNVALETRVDHDARMGHEAGTKKWETANVPLPNSPNGIEMAVFSDRDCADGSQLHSGTVGNTRTLKEAFEWSVDVCYAAAYNSSPSTRYNPFVKVEISNS
jgi:hypothetical protein